MSTRVEWVDMDHPFFGMGWVQAGAPVLDDSEDEEDMVPAGNVALVLSYDEVVVLIGTPEVMRERLQRALDTLEDA